MVAHRRSARPDKPSTVRNSTQFSEMLRVRNHRIVMIYSRSLQCDNVTT